MLFATCARGLGPYLSTELSSAPIHATVLHTASSGVTFTSSTASMLVAYRALLWSRLSMRILYLISTVQVPSLLSSDWRSVSHSLYLHLRSLSWSQLLPCVDFRVFSRVSPSCVLSAQHVSSITRSAILSCAAASGPSAARADVWVVIHDDCAKVYLDLAGRSLHKRGWRGEGKLPKAALNETVAAGMLYIAGFAPDGCFKGEWRPGLRIADPMCGGGGLAVELGMLRMGIAPGAIGGRRGFAVDAWGARLEKDAWETAWREVREGRREEAECTVFAGDRDAGAAQMARNGAKRAGVGDIVRVRCEQMQAWGEHVDGVVCNPPWGGRLQTEDAWEALGEWMRRWADGGWGVVMSGGEMRVKGMKTGRKIPVRIGGVQGKVLVYGVGEQWQRETQSGNEHNERHKTARKRRTRPSQRRRRDDAKLLF